MEDGPRITATDSRESPVVRHPSWNVRTRLLAGALRGAARRVTALDPYHARALLDGLGRLAPPVRSVRRSRDLVGGVPCEWYLPAGAEPLPVLVHVHGGGYALCSNSTHRLMISDIARASRMRSLGVDYRLAPEHPYPAGLDDCVAVLHALADRGIGGEDLVLTGDSAGATLGLAAMIRLRDEGAPLPRAAALLSPWADLACEGATIESHALYDYLSCDVLRFFAKLYLQGADSADALASPVHADLRGLPPVLIHAGGAEMLLSDIRELARRLDEAGVEVTLEVWDGMIHAFHGFTTFLPEARRALARVGEFLRAEVGRRGRDGPGRRLPGPGP